MCVKGWACTPTSLAVEHLTDSPGQVKLTELANRVGNPASLTATHLDFSHANHGEGAVMCAHNCGVWSLRVTLVMD